MDRVAGGVMGTPDEGHGSSVPGAQPRVRLVALDLDGVVYRGGMVLPGAPEALQGVLDRGLDLRYVSNNSTAHRRTVSERLEGMGVPAGPERVITSGYATGLWLRARLPAGAPLMVVGEEGLMTELTEAGFAPVCASEAAQDPSEADAGREIPAAVVVGMDRAFNFRTLATAQRAIIEGALFVATNRDASFPTPWGVVPGAGAIVAAVATAARKEPVVIGKPSPTLAEVLAKETGVSAGETVFVGDRVSTDIVMGHEAGMVSVLVLTGVTGGGDPRNALADYVIDDLRGLGEILDGLTG